MRKQISYGVAPALALALWALAAGASPALAQGQNSSPAADVPRDEINHDVQIYLLVASNDAGERVAVPQQLEGVVRQLRAALPFSSYRLAATYLNRVKDGGSLEVSGVGGSPLIAAAGNPSNPTFFQLSLSNVKLFTGADGQPFIRVARFRFGLKVPIQTATVAGEGGRPSYPTIQYQDTGVSTEMSAREGAATVVGTLAASPPGESFILVMTLKRTPAR